MYIYVEMWNVTQAWMDLSKDKRAEFINGIKSGLQKLTDSGVENLGWAMNDEHTPHRSDFRYLTIWKMPSLDKVKELEKWVSTAGWHKYFSQQNSRGKIMPYPEAFDFLVNLERQSSSLTE